MAKLGGVSRLQCLVYFAVFGSGGFLYFAFGLQYAVPISGVHFRQFREREIIEMTGDFKTPLGEGLNAKVFEGVWDDTMVAVKRVNLKDPILRKKWENEKDMLQLFYGHPNFVKYIGYGVGKENGEGYIVLEYFPIGLIDIVNGSFTDFKWKDLIDIMIKILNALNYIHDKDPRSPKKYIYVDLKAENILLDITQGYVPKIIDLGSIVREGASNYDYTRDFSAPEAARGTTSSSRSMIVDVKTDVYGFGMTVKQLLGSERKSRKKEEAEDNKKKKSKGIDLRMSRSSSSNPKDMVGKIVKRSGASEEALRRICSLVTDCTRTRKESRPSMNDVQTSLQEIKDL